MRQTREGDKLQSSGVLHKSLLLLRLELSRQAREFAQGFLQEA